MRRVRHFPLAASWVALMLASGMAAAVPWGISFEPMSPDSYDVLTFQVRIPTGHSWPRVHEHYAHVEGNVVRLYACHTTFGFAVPGFYHFSETVGPLPAGSYVVEHWAAGCSSPESIGPYQLRTSTTLEIREGVPEPSDPQAVPTPGGLVMLVLGGLIGWLGRFYLPVSASDAAVSERRRAGRRRP